ncbi:hypothetical protein PFISCL1PPCAC_1174 [Pristionchus fissidentatus]|uniref:Uncharacterized protein n=1 Tax=Pristionchus fissidentatus TaxID=1538716 RepID=A0AAV5URW9_9BILA|nr:hypothetical protein PFISCL1PPCAC_1174 [Pristionchus fissidentatus]
MTLQHQSLFLIVCDKSPPLLSQLSQILLICHALEQFLLGRRELADNFGVNPVVQQRAFMFKLQKNLVKLVEIQVVDVHHCSLVPLIFPLQYRHDLFSVERRIEESVFYELVDSSCGNSIRQKFSTELWLYCLHH